MGQEKTVVEGAVGMVTVFLAAGAWLQVKGHADSSGRESFPVFPAAS